MYVLPLLTMPQPHQMQLFSLVSLLIAYLYTELTTFFTLISVSPEGSVTVTPRNTTVSVGDDVTLTCSAQGGPNNTFEWQHETMPINVTTAFLTIPSISVSEGGDYICTVRNTAGSGRFTSTVFIQPTIEAIEDIYTTNGSSIEFVCEVNGIPTPNVTWERVTVDEIVTVSSTNVYNISPVEFGDEGDYQCVATSLAGNASVIATLIRM